MHWQSIPYVFPVIASAVVSAMLAFTAWQRRPLPGAVPFCLLMLAMTEWSLSFALELLSSDLASALLWENITWIGAVTAPTLWLVFALRYTGRAPWLMRRNLVLLALFPIVTLLLVWTNQFHGLVWSHVRLERDGPFSTLSMTLDTWYWVQSIYAFMLCFLGIFVICSFILTVSRSAHLYCVQGACLLIAILAPSTSTIVKIIGLSPFLHLNLTPFGFPISCLAFAAGFFLFRLLDIVPIAREVVVEQMRDAVIVLDAYQRIVDLNPPARQLIGNKAAHAIGKPLAEVFSAWPELVRRCHDNMEVDEEITLANAETTRHFNLRIAPLHHHDGRLAISGHLIILQDRTERVRASRALMESEQRLSSLFAEVPIGMAIIDGNGQFLQVNRALCEMSGYREQELLGHSLATITHPGDLAKDRLLAERTLKGEIASYHIEKRFFKKNHETLWADLTATTLRRTDDQKLYSLIMLEDIIERKRIRLLEEERHHMVYELHDGVAQTAASTHQHLQAFASRYHPSSALAKQQLNQTLELAQRTVREARRLIAGLRPTALDDFGLAVALRLQMEAYRADGWTIRYHEALGSVVLPPAIEKTLFSIIQEALTNIRKHAGTKQLRLSLTYQDSKIRLEVQDWGCGFEFEALNAHHPGEHVGLRGMQERVELVSGHFLISSQADIGTLLVIEIPVPSPEERGL